MNKKKPSADKNVTSDGFAYLTKRKLVMKAKAAGKAAAKQAMDVMGFVITQKEGQIVKQYENGEVEILAIIKKVNLRKK